MKADQSRGIMHKKKAIFKQIWGGKGPFCRDLQMLGLRLRDSTFQHKFVLLENKINVRRTYLKDDHSSE